MENKKEMHKKILSSSLVTVFFLSLVLIENNHASQPALLQSIQNGKIVYTQTCLTCHQADGGGVPHLNAPLDGASAVQGPDKTKLIKIVLKGMTDRVEIDGEYYSNNMAPHSNLTDKQIADVLTYVRNSWTNKASAVTAAEVKAVRAKLK